MSIKVQSLPLSALNPTEVSYYYNNNEALSGSYRLYTNGLQTYSYELFKGFKDAAISKKTALVLTNIKDLKQVFETPSKFVDIGYISGNCYLQTNNNQTLNGDVAIKLYNNNLWIGGKGEPAVFTIIPVEVNVVELKVNDFYVQVSNEYPFDIILSKTPLVDSERYRQKFTINFKNELISLKHLTSEGYRYLSYNLNDRKLRCVGTQLNQAIISQYLFNATFVSSVTLPYGYNPSIQEIKYYNTVDSGVKQKTVDVSEKTQTDTNLLVTLPTLKFLNTDKPVTANISILKTNFSSTGAFINKL